MRGLFVVIFLFAYLSSFTQVKRDERKLSFLLNKETDSLCIDCIYQDCKALFYNAPLFENLEKLVIKNFDVSVPFRFIGDFKKLNSLELINPYPFDFQKEIIKVKKVLKLKRLSITSDSLVPIYVKGLGYFNKRRFFKNLISLRSLEIRNVDIGLANDIKKINRLKRLKELKLVGIGVTLHHFNKMNDRRYDVLELDEHIGEVRYTKKFNGNLFSNRSWSMWIPRYNNLTLHPNVSGLKKNVIPYQPTLSYGAPSEDFKREFAFNSDYGSWYPFYSRYAQGEVRGPSLLRDTSRFKYVGTLKTGKPDAPFYSLAYRQYDNFLTWYDYNKWDTTKSIDRQKNLNYSNGNK